MAEVAAWARHHDVVLHAHLSEQPAENAACLAAYGVTPTELLADLGVLGPRFVAVHATHLSDRDVELLGASAASVCLCPTTERDLADGIGPASRLAAAGTSLCLGSDAHAVIDLWEEARAVELDERLASGRRGQHQPPALLAAATAGGAAALGWTGGGHWQPGAPADFCTLRTDGVALAGTVGSDGRGAAAAAVFAGRASDVTDVVVGGRAVVARGEHCALGPVGPLLRAALAGLSSAP
jgi:cytosine/adenosine deaminase-related metal-dependent hydrolase